MLRLDNSKIETFRRCPRLYQFEHVLHWRQQGINPAIEFGTAWGAAMNDYWQTLSVTSATAAFKAAWVGPAQITPMLKKAWGDKSPQTAERMLEAYARRNARWVEEAQPVEHEVGFEVKLSAELTYTGCVDKAVNVVNGVPGLIVEHKSTSWGYGKQFNQAWLDMYRLDSQVDGYSYVFDCPVVVDAVLVHPTSPISEKITINNPEWRVAEWLSEVRYWGGAVAACHASGIFPRNRNGCYAYNRLCPFFDICTKCVDVTAIDLPMGFKEEVWDPINQSTRVVRKDLTNS